MKKTILISILLISILAFTACTGNPADKKIFGKEKILSFEDCISAGYPAMESYPRQCSDGTNTFTEEILHCDTAAIRFDINKETGECEEITTYGCDADKIAYNSMEECIENNVKPCTREYIPVCGEVKGVKETFSNKCMAENANAQNIVQGKCKEDIKESPGKLIEEFCIQEGGVWLEQQNECEYMPQNVCEELGGNFKECESACRHDKDAQICTMQCVLVCEF